MKSIRTLLEGEIEKAQSALAARDMVDQMQEMIEKLNKLKVEELAALKETMRDSMGNEVADQFVQTTTDALQSAIDAVTQAHATVDQAALAVSGEGDMPAAGGEAGADLGAEEPAAADAEAGEQAPEAPVTDVAAGGEEPLGRGKRESREREMRKMLETLERKIAKLRAIKEAKSPYAVGMAQAMKSTGDKPPLKKSTITKAHEIAKAIKKDEVKEGSKPDFLDLDKDGNKKEPMKKAAKDAAKKGTKRKGVAEGSSTKNEYGIDFKDIKVGDKVVFEDGEILTVISKTRFRNGMLALKVKDKSKDQGWSLANFLEVKKVRKSVAEARDILPDDIDELKQVFKYFYSAEGYADAMKIIKKAESGVPVEDLASSLNEFVLKKWGFKLESSTAIQAIESITFPVRSKLKYSKVKAKSTPTEISKLANEIIEAIKLAYANQGIELDGDIDFREFLNDAFPDEPFTDQLNDLDYSAEKKVAAIVKREVNKHFGGQDDIKDARGRGLMRGWLR